MPRAWLPLVAFENPPATPVLGTISDPGGAPSYVVNWSAAKYATSYALQEDTTGAFTNPITVYSGASTQWQASGQAPALYYYRVQGVNSHGGSAWSNIESVTVYGFLTPNDLYYPYQWGPPMIGAPLAWYYSSGSAITIAVVDTGVDQYHEDLSGKILPGYNFVKGNTDTQDDNGHGTQVAGIAAAVGNNNTGIAGMAWNAQILPVKVLNSSGGGYFSDIANGITWAVDHGAKIVNLSLGSTYNSSTLADATDYAYNQGSLVTAAAGNCGDGNYALNGCAWQDQTFYPAANAGVVAVGATDSSDSLASFSTANSYLWVSAPGVDILSTLVGNTYGYESGTSMAAPVVSGLEALVWAANPSFSNAQVANLIANTAVRHGTSFDPGYGYGRVDAGAAVLSAMSGAAPAAPAAKTSALAPVTGTPTSTAASAGRPVRPGVVLVRLKSIARTQAGKSQAMSRHGAQAIGEIPALGVTVASVPAGQERQIAAEMSADPTVEYAEPDYFISLVR